MNRGIVHFTDTAYDILKQQYNTEWLKGDNNNSIEMIAIILILGVVSSMAHKDDSIHKHNSISVLDENKFSKELAKKAHLVLFYVPG